MDCLPRELVPEILSRLPIPSLVQSKSVCRAWRILIQDQEFVDKHFKRMIDNDPSFILQIIGNAIQNQLYFGDFSSHPNGGNVMITKKLTIPPLSNFHLVSSCNGLLCLRFTRPSFGLCIYNPFTRDYIELPKIITKNPASHHGSVLGFGLDPTTKKYKVVEVSYKGITCRTLPRRVAISSMRRPPLTAAYASSIESEVYILTVGSPTWRNLGRFPFHLMWQKSQVLVHDKLHWIYYPDTINATDLIMSFDLANEQFNEVPRPDFVSSDMRFHELVVLRGCLSAVSSDNEGLEIWVMKEYDVRESWVKEFSIGTYVPRILQPNDQCESWNNSRFYLPKRSIRVLCQLRSGGILLEYRNKALVIYDPHCRIFHDLQVTFAGISTYFRIVVHVASLNWIETT